MAPAKARTMDAQHIISELQRYERELNGILSRFRKSPDGGLHATREDDSKLRQYTRELVDLCDDAFGRNPYSAQIANEFNEGISNFYGTPSYHCVENILSSVRAALTRLNRNPGLLVRKTAANSLLRRENIFIIHGRNEAKWRELKDILQSQFRLNPIVLLEQADEGSITVIEKFERHAQTCSVSLRRGPPSQIASFRRI
jgi:hypothetical protein